MPALDGLRGLAVAVVLAYHGGLGLAGGGFLGVSLFFTLSGFLITSLLVAERAGTGRISLRDFWIRRIRRLAPAGLVGLGLAVVAAMVALPAAERSAAVLDVRAAVLQVANWRFVLADAPYAGLDAVPSPVLHHWSLAIEEQFYLVFPVVALLALRRGVRALAAVLAAVVAVSLWRQGVLAGDRVYFGTDTRAAEIAIGGLLALGWRASEGWRARVVSSHAFDLVGGLGLVATGALWVGADQSDPVLLGGGLTAVACLSCLVLLGALGGGRVAAALGWAPLRAVGLVSYGLYVVHWPIFLVVSPDRVGLDGLALLAVRLGVTVAIAVPLHRLVEQPIRSGSLRMPRPATAGAVVGVGLLLVASVPIVSALEGARRAAQRPMATGLSAAGPAWRSAPAEVAVPGPVATSFPAAVDAPPGPDPTAPGPAPTAPSTTEVPVRRPARVVVVGDSTGRGVGEGLQAWGARTGAVQASIVAMPGCPVLPGEVARYREGYEHRPAGCADLFPVAVQEARRVDADAVVVVIGAAQVADWRYGADPEWRSILEPQVAASYRTAMAAAADLLADRGRFPVLWADLPAPDWDLDAFGALMGGRVLPGEGPPVTNDPRRAEALNHASTAVARERPGLVMVPFARGLAGPDGVIGPQDRADGLHLSAAQAEAAAEGWLVALLARAHEQALAEAGEVPEAAVRWLPDT